MKDTLDGPKGQETEEVKDIGLVEGLEALIILRDYTNWLGVMFFPQQVP